MTAAVKSPDDQQFGLTLQQAWQEHQSGQIKSAEKRYRQLLEFRPEDFDSNNLMGLLLIQTGRSANAEVHLRKAVETDPGNPQTFYNLGIACKNQHKWSEAADAFRQCVTLSPDNVDCINSMANCLRISGQLEDAGKWFDRALELQPGHPPVLLNRGMLLNQLQRYEEAESCLQQAISKGAGNAEAWNDLGVARGKLGKPGPALEAYQQATSLRADFAKAWLNRGIFEEQFGLLEEAGRSFRQALSAEPGLVDAHFRLAHLRSHQSTGEEIDAMAQLAAQESLPVASAARLSYGLAMAHEKAGAYDRAFHFMQQAHELLAAENPFNFRAHHKQVMDSIEWFDAGRMRLPAKGASGDQRPLFIAGMPRSGTTLAEQILASHPDVFGAGEQVILARLARVLSAETGIHYPDCLEHASREQIQQSTREYEKAAWREAGDAERVTDTTPMNFMVFGLAAQLFPRARFIVCRRDPIDNCLSIYRQQLTQPHAYAHDLDTLGRYYRLHETLIGHWKAVLGDRLYMLQYEQLVAEPEGAIRRLLKFCGLPFDAACLAFHDTDRMVTSPSASQVRQPIYSTSVGAWKNYEKHLQPLIDGLSG